jgi:hypothetical protein
MAMLYNYVERLQTIHGMCDVVAESRGLDAPWELWNEKQIDAVNCGC